MNTKHILWFLFIPLFAYAQASDTQALLSLLIGAFGAGLLLTFTPCVLPMVPIISSIVAGQGEKVTKTKGLALSFSYVMGTAVTYALMGALAGASGEQLQAYFQNSWALSIMSFIFLLMALSMFGFFTLQMPSFIQSKLDSETHKIKGGTFFAVFILGLVSALILGACVSPVLISFLSVAIAKADPVMGAEMMFALAMGMGVPLLAVGLGAGYLLPKAGAWMDEVKHFFGILLLAVAISIFSEMDLFSSLYLWGAYFIIIGVAMNPFGNVQEEYSAWKKLLKGLGALLFAWGLITLIGAAMGNKNLYKPLENKNIFLTQNSVVQKETKPLFTKVANLQEFDKKLQEALEANKPLFVYFHSKYCKVCKELDDTTFQDQKVIQILRNNYVSLIVDLSDRSNEASNAIKKKYNVFGYPAFLMIDSDGTPQLDAIHYGYESAKELYDVLDLNS